MSAPTLRVLFALGINQNFFDLPSDRIGEVWVAFSGFLTEMREMPGVDVLGDMDDDAHQVGPSEGWPWTAYVLADVVDQPTVRAVCNLLRTTGVGDGTYKLWKYAKIEARMGRPLTVREEVKLPA